MKNAIAVGLGLLMLATAISPVALATGTTPSGTWTIGYFTENTCTTAWPTFSTDGGGFATGNPAQDPVVAPGQTIFVQITVTGGSANTAFTYELDGGNSPWPPVQALFTTDGSGDASSCFGVSITQDQANAVTGPGCTVPEKVNDDGSIIDHLILTGSNNGNGCSGTTTTTTTTTGGCTSNCPPPVPEFPVGIAPVLLLAVPLLFLFRKRFVAGPTVSAFRRITGL